MAKMFYTVDETKAALGKSDEEIKELAREGRLREFRDGARLMFKADQVENLKSELTETAEPLALSPEDSGFAISFNDEKEASGSHAGLPLAEPGSSSGSTAGGSTVSTQEKEDTAMASELGLTGSLSGMPSSSRAGSGISGSSGSKSGIDVFGEDSNAEKSDPSAATSIAAAIGADQMNIESVGSGSGLLDLTNERDDTSLGAELLDEIAPGASGVRRAPAGESAMAGSLSGSLSASGTGVGMSEPRASAGPRVPLTVEAPDPLAPAFGMAAVAAACVGLFATFALMCGLFDNHPTILSKMGSAAPGGFSFLIVVGFALALPVLFFVGGFFYSKAGKK